MKKNLSAFDRVFRLLLALAVVALYYTKQITGTTALVLLIIAGILALTGIMSFCPIYRLLNISSRKGTAGQS